MSIHILTGQGAPAVPSAGEHLATKRRRTYPSDTTDVKWQILAPLVPVGGTRPRKCGRPVVYHGGTWSTSSASWCALAASETPCRWTGPQPGCGLAVQVVSKLPDSPGSWCSTVGGAFERFS